MGNFKSAKLTDTDFTNAIISGASFSSTTSNGFTKEQLYSTKSYKDKDLSGVWLDGNDLSDWDFREQKLSGARFDSATLTGTDFSNADLSNVTFIFTTLTGVNFSNANLTNAGFYFSTLKDVDFRGATNSPEVNLDKSQNVIMSDGNIEKFSMLSSSDSFSIRKYTPNPNAGNNYSEELISAKLGHSSTVSGGATLTLERGADFEVVNSGTILTFDTGGLVINTDMDNSTKFTVGDGAGIEFKEGATLTINLIIEENTPAGLSDFYKTIFVMDWTNGSNVLGLDELVKDETLFFSVNGEKFSGDWDFFVENNQFAIAMGTVPEPAACAAVFGLFALAFSAFRRRK